MYITRNREPFFELVRPFLKNNGTVLDIGAGNGSFARYFNRDDFFLIDGNELTVNQFKKEFPNYSYAKLPELNFCSSFFDVIHVSHVMEHLEIEVFYKTLIEIDKCLKFGGILVVSMPTLTDFFYDDLSHVKPYNPSIFLKYLTNGKFNNLTRTKISDNYHLLKLQYRYESKKIMEFPEGTKNAIFFILNKFFGFLKILGIKKYVKTGYTIILQKG